MNSLINVLTKFGLLKDDLDYRLVCGSMVVNVPFLMKDVVPFAASVYLLEQDVVRVLKERDVVSVSTVRQAA